MKAPVQLPADLLIDYWRFCQAIAQAICPAGEQDLEGVDCIVGKLVTHHVAMAVPMSGKEKWPITAGLQSVLLSDDGRTLDQLRLDQQDVTTSSTPFLPLDGELNRQVVEVTLPCELTDDDRRLVEKLLPQLPALRSPISEDDMATFMGAYFNLPNRPAWEPILVTAMMIERRKVEQDAIMRHHQTALQDELNHGRLSAVNANHIPVAKLAIGYFIPRDQAISYLDRYGISHCDKLVSDRRDAETKAPENHWEPHEGKQSAVGKSKLTDLERGAVVARYNELKNKKVKNYCKQTADEFGITDRYVRELVKASKLAKNEARIDQLLVNNGQ